MRSRRGHVALPHTADVILEAWGPDLAACCEEAVAALVGTFALTTGAAPVEHRLVHIAPARDESLLLDVLEEIIFILDTADAVPVGAAVRVAADGGLDVVVALADRRQVNSAGAAPKAISRSELHVASEPGGVRCRFLVDV